MPLDERAVRILKDTHWSSAGWKRNRAVTPEDFAHAKSHGVMFDTFAITHDEAVSGALEAVSATDRESVVQAFVASLGSRRLELRSALGSYAVGRHMKPHESATGVRCLYCGAYGQWLADLNVLNFERLKWGGVRHDRPDYIAFDLRTFGAALDIAPRAEDWAILRAILDVAGSMPARARPRDLDKALAKVLPSNSAERRILIGILGLTGILVDPARPDFRTGFVPETQREQTRWHTDDWPYPVQWWAGAHGVNQAAVQHWFGGLQA